MKHAGTMLHLAGSGAVRRGFGSLILIMAFAGCSHAPGGTDAYDERAVLRNVAVAREQLANDPLSALDDQGVENVSLALQPPHGDPVTPSHNCNIDAILLAGGASPSHVFAVGSKPTLVGWLLNPDRKGAPSLFTVELQGQRAYGATAHGGTSERNDVVRSFNLPSNVMPGIKVRLDTSALERGDYTVVLRGVDTGQHWMCVPGTKISLR